MSARNLLGGRWCSIECADHLSSLQPGLLVQGFVQARHVQHDVLCGIRSCSFTDRLALQSEGFADTLLAPGPGDALRDIGFDPPHLELGIQHLAVDVVITDVELASYCRTGPASPTAVASTLWSRWRHGSWLRSARRASSCKALKGESHGA